MPATRKRKEQSKDQSSLFLGIKPYAAKKGEKYMNKKQQEHFHGKLLAWRRELEDEITRTVHQMRDEPDNRILECAVAGKADVVVTGDQAMLRLGSYRRIRILSLKDFLAGAGPA